MVALEPLDGEQWQAVGCTDSRPLKLCRNYQQYEACNWALDAEDPEALCQSCRLTHTIPDLSVHGYQEAWVKLEMAKRRALYSVLTLQLPLSGKSQDPGRS